MIVGYENIVDLQIDLWLERVLQRQEWMKVSRMYTMNGVRTAETEDLSLIHDG